MRSFPWKLKQLKMLKNEIRNNIVEIKRKILDIEKKTQSIKIKIEELKKLKIFRVKALLILQNKLREKEKMK